MPRREIQSMSARLRPGDPDPAQVGEWLVDRVYSEAEVPPNFTGIILLGDRDGGVYLRGELIGSARFAPPPSAIAGFIGKLFGR